MSQPTAETAPTAASDPDELSLRNRLYKAKDLSVRFGLLFNNPYTSDVTFVFETENVEVYGHQIILITGGPVFCTMFDNHQPSKHSTLRIKLNDITSTIFKEVIHYVYTNKFHNLTESNAIEILCGARNYGVAYLERALCDILLAKVTIENVCKYYDASFWLSNEFTEKCEEIIQQHTTDVLTTNGFVSLSALTMKQILSFDRLAAEEDELFAAMMRWATGACQAAELSVSAANKRAVLKGAEKRIRFPTMTLEVFRQCVASEAGFFTKNEIDDNVRAIMASVSIPVGSFSPTKRIRPEFC